ncbi:MAG: aminotransferase class I/II-fold pyridoxal phosphate-dependent enzyme [Candidatus Vogelbacteria bacterium]|nr:aminotransferase class I/II-fold pyridoxal phosphate-dependent enzyme [Candidatus Vogelbacteria bacterium]
MRVPYGFSVHGKEEIDAVVKVLEHNTALGEKAKEFEHRVATMFGKKYGVMVNSGSSANLLAFEILNLPKGSEVITPILTFATVIAPIIQKGLVPVFVDVDPDTYLINIDQVEKAISKKTKALMIPSLMGNIPDMERLAKLAKKHKLWFIEDSCDTLGGSYNGKPTGTHSHITTSSFYGSHIINGAGGGGIICVNNPKWVDRLVVLRGWGRQSSLFGEKANSELLENRFKQKLAGVPYDNKFIFSEIGYNFLPLEISAAFALEQLKKFPKFKELRTKHFNDLYKFFKQYEHIFTLANKTHGSETVWLAFPLIIKKGAPFARFELITFLENNNIQTRPVFTGNILKQPGFRKFPHRLAQKTFPNTEHIMRNAFVVGSHHGLITKQIEYLKEKFRDFLSNHKINPK